MISSQQSYSNRSFATIPASHDITPVVAEIGELEFTGNLTPHSWYSEIKLPSGHTDLVAITLLGEIAYQYRPGVVRDEATGEPLHKFKRFARDKFCAPIAYFCKKFGLTKDQVRQGLKRLEEAGYIRREYRDILVAGRWVRGMTFIEPVPERIRAITPPPRPDARPTPGAVQRPKTAVRQRCVVATSKKAGSVPEDAVSAPGGAVPIPPYKDTAKIPKKTTTPPTPPSSRDTSSSSWSRQQKEKSTPRTTTPPPPPTTTASEPTTVTAGDRTPPTTTTTKTDTPPPPTVPAATSAAPAEPLGSPALLTLLLFDFYLADLTTAQKAELCQRLARLPAPLAQTVLDEYNSAVGRKVQFRNKWGWFEFLIRAALEGRFIPTSDLAERRAAQVQAQAQAQVQAATATTSVSTPQARQPSAVWEAHQEELVRLFPPNEVGINLSPLRALEDGHILWLEAPNTFVVNWVRAHLPQIEAVLRPHIALPIRVCIG